MFKTMVPLLKAWEKVFAQKRSAKRALNQAISILCVVGQRTIARSYLLSGDSAPLAPAIVADSFDGPERLAIYRNNFLISLGDVTGNIYRGVPD